MKVYKYSLYQYGLMVAYIETADKDQAEKEIQHYAFMYEQDGPVQIKRKVVITK